MCVLLSDVVRTVAYHVLYSYIGEESVCSAGGARDVGLIPGLGRFPGGGNGNPLQCSCPKTPQRSLAGCSPWGHRVGHDLDTKQQQALINHLVYVYLTSLMYFVLN